AFLQERGLFQAEAGVVVHRVVLVHVHVGQVRVPVEQGLCVDAGQDGRVRHDLLVDPGPDPGSGGNAGRGQRRGEQVIYHRVVEFADVGVAAGLDDGASGQVVQEAESVWPVRSPAADGQPEVVLVRVIRHAGEGGEELFRRVALQGHADPGTGEGLLFPGRRDLLLRLVDMKG